MTLIQAECDRHGLTEFRQWREWERDRFDERTGVVLTGFVCWKCERETKWDDDCWRHQQWILRDRFSHIVAE